MILDKSNFSIDNEMKLGMKISHSKKVEAAIKVTSFLSLLTVRFVHQLFPQYFRSALMNLLKSPSHSLPLIVLLLYYHTQQGTVSNYRSYCQDNVTSVDKIMCRTGNEFASLTSTSIF